MGHTAAIDTNYRFGRSFRRPDIAIVVSHVHGDHFISLDLVVDREQVDVIMKTVRIIGIDHVQLAMPSGGEERARGFYAGLLSIREVPKPPELAVRGGCWFEDGDLKIHLGVEEKFSPALKAHPALIVEDLEILITKLAEADVVVETKDVEGQIHAYIHDPFGNRIELLGLN